MCDHHIDKSYFYEKSFCAFRLARRSRSLVRPSITSLSPRFGGRPCFPEGTYCFAGEAGCVVGEVDGGWGPDELTCPL